MRDEFEVLGIGDPITAPVHCFPEYKSELGPASQQQPNNPKN
jgi:hypothetical protein